MYNLEKVEYSDVLSTGKFNNKFGNICIFGDLHLDINLEMLNKSGYKKYTSLCARIYKPVCLLYFCYGDISANSKHVYGLFWHLRDYVSKIEGRRPLIVFVLGNHECSQFQCVSEAVNYYKSMLSYLGVAVLYNQLIAINSFHCYLTYKTCNVNKLGTSDSDSNGDIIYVYGTIGFGCNDQKFFNFNIKDDIVDIDIGLNDNMKKFKKFNKDLPLVCLTHFPIKESNQNFTAYINGHTHNNGSVSIDGIIHYSCGQTGHPAKALNEGYLVNIKESDYLSRQVDGIGLISNTQYISFLRKYSSDYVYDSGKFKNDVIYIKYKGYYMFVVKQEKTNKLMILRGLRKKSLLIGNIDYYAERFLLYVGIVRKIYIESGFIERINDISKYVRSIGGSGKIHGSIVDIDFFHHVWVDPKSLYTVWYFAESMSNCLIYKNPMIMLRKIGYIGEQDELPDVIRLDTPEEVYENAEVNMYKISSSVFTVQSLIRDGILREWNDGVDLLVDYFYNKHIDTCRTNILVDNV